MQILREQGVEPDLVDYLKVPPDETTVRELARKMNLRPKDFIRKNEGEFKKLGLREKLEDDSELIKQMAAHPKLIERPIAVRGNKAVLGRPPEKVLELLE